MSPGRTRSQDLLHRFFLGAARSTEGAQSPRICLVIADYTALVVQYDQTRKTLNKRKAMGKTLEEDEQQCFGG